MLARAHLIDKSCRFLYRSTTTAQLPFSAKLFSPPPKQPSTRDREYLRSPEVKAMIRANFVTN
jgi:hypothetical protein